MNSSELLYLFNLLESIQKTQEKIIEELKKSKSSTKVSVEELESNRWLESDDI